MVRRVLAWAAVTVLLLSGCAGAPATATPAIATVPPTATAVPSATAVPTAAETSTTSATPAPSETPPAPGFAAISADNAASLVAAAQFTLPDFPLHLAWRGANLLLPAQSGLIEVDTTAGTLSGPQPLALPPGQIMAAAPDGSSLLLRLEDTRQGVLYNWDGTLIASLSYPAEPYNAAYSADSRSLAVASADEWTVALYTLPASPEEFTALAGQGQPLRPAVTLTGFETAAPVYQAIVSNGGKNIAWIARASLEFQDAQSGELGGKLGYTDFITASAFSPEGEQLAVSAPGRLEIYAAPQGELLAGVDLSEPLQDLAYSTDGSLLASAYAGGIQLWDAQTLVPLSYLAAASPAGRISFSPDGATLASLHGDGTLTLWRVP